MSRFLMLMGLTLAVGTLSGWGLFYAALLYVDIMGAINAAWA